MNKIVNYIKPFLHILFWSVLFVIPLYIMSRNSYMDNNPYISFFIRAGILIVLFYINYLLLIDKFFFTKRFVLYFAINIGLALMLVALQSLLFDLLMQHGPPRLDDGHKPPPMGLFKFWDYIVIVLTIGMSIAIKMTMRWNRDSINYEKMKSMQLEADLRNLRSQLNPHFLFNTLNNIYSLIAFDQHKAQESVHRLSGLLRYILYDNDQQFVPIDKELEFTKNYIDLMTLRIPQNVKLTIAIDANGSTDQVASLMFITLIENAFKHGINTNKACFIDITIAVKAGEGVLCTVENSLPDGISDLESKNSGIGLVNLTKRLALLYSNKHEFVAEKRAENFYCRLRIDFDKTQIEGV